MPCTSALHALAALHTHLCTMWSWLGREAEDLHAPNASQVWFWVHWRFTRSRSCCLSLACCLQA